MRARGRHCQWSPCSPPASPGAAGDRPRRRLQSAIRTGCPPGSDIALTGRRRLEHASGGVLARRRRVPCDQPGGRQLRRLGGRPGACEARRRLQRRRNDRHRARRGEAAGARCRSPSPAATATSRSRTLPSSISLLRRRSRAVRLTGDFDGDQRTDLALIGARVNRCFRWHCRMEMARFAKTDWLSGVDSPIPAGRSATSTAMAETTSRSPGARSPRIGSWWDPRFPGNDLGFDAAPDSAPSAREFGVGLARRASAF